MCTSGSASSCEECLLIHPKCAWCSKEVRGQTLFFALNSAVGSQVLFVTQRGGCSPPLCLSWCQRVLVRAAGAPAPSVAHATCRKCPPPCSGSSAGASGLLFLQFPSCFLPGSPRNPGMCPVLQQRSFPLDCVLLGGNQHFWHVHCHQGDELRSLTACFVAKMHPVLVLKLLSGYLPWSSLVCKKLQIPFPKYSLWVFIYTSYRMCVLPSRLTIFRD